MNMKMAARVRCDTCMRMHFFAHKHWFCVSRRAAAIYPMIVSANTTVNLACPGKRGAPTGFPALEIE
jgi:hypothetical protein